MSKERNSDTCRGIDKEDDKDNAFDNKESIHIREIKKEIKKLRYLFGDNRITNDPGFREARK